MTFGDIRSLRKSSRVRIGNGGADVSSRPPRCPAVVGRTSRPSAVVLPGYFALHVPGQGYGAFSEPAWDRPIKYSFRFSMIHYHLYYSPVSITVAIRDRVRSGRESRRSRGDAQPGRARGTGSPIGKPTPW